MWSAPSGAGRTDSGDCSAPSSTNRTLRLADLTSDPRFAGFPPGHPPMRTFLGVPIRVQGEIFGNLYLAEKADGGEFNDYDLHMVRVLATEAGIAIGNARLYEAARQRERWIDGSVAVTTALLSGGDADDALSVVAEQARHLAGSAAGIVLLPAEDGGLEIVAVSADDPSASLGVIIPAHSPVVARLLNGEAVFVADSATDSRMITRLADRFGPSMMLPLHSGAGCSARSPHHVPGAGGRSRRRSGPSPPSSPRRRPWRS